MLFHLTLPGTAFPSLPHGPPVLRRPGSRMQPLCVFRAVSQVRALSSASVCLFKAFILSLTSTCQRGRVGRGVKASKTQPSDQCPNRTPPPIASICVSCCARCARSLSCEPSTGRHVRPRPVGTSFRGERRARPTPKKHTKTSERTPTTNSRSSSLTTVRHSPNYELISKRIRTAGVPGRSHAPCTDPRRSQLHLRLRLQNGLLCSCLRQRRCRTDPATKRGVKGSNMVLAPQPPAGRLRAWPR